MRSLVVFALAWVAAASFGQEEFSGNPVIQVGRTFGTGGFDASKTLQSGPSEFKKGRSTGAAAKVIGALELDQETETTMLEGVAELQKNFEAAAAEAGQKPDVAAAFGFFLQITLTISKGAELNAAHVDASLPQLKAFFNKPAVQQATDAQKQEAYEFYIASASVPLLLALAAGENDQVAAGIQRFAGGLVLGVTGAETDAISYSARGLGVKAVAPPTMASSGTRPAGGTQMGSGQFRYSLPAGYRQEGGWISKIVNAETRGDRVGAMFRVLTPIPAQGNMDSVLNQLWGQVIPDGIQPRQVMFRRYVAGGAYSQFLFGRGPEGENTWDTYFTLFLIDLGGTWQPVVMAQVFLPDPTFMMGASMSAHYAQFQNGPIAAEFIDTWQAPGAPKRPLVTREEMTGLFKGGSTATQHWASAITGQYAGMTFSAASIDYNFRANGTFDYKFVGASGAVGAMTVTNDADSGSWSIEGDILTINGAKWDRSFRVWGFTRYGDGRRAVMLNANLKQAVFGTLADSVEPYFAE